MLSSGASCADCYVGVRSGASCADCYLGVRSRASCADSYVGVRSTPVLPQQHVKDPGYSAKSAGGRLQLNTHALYICGFA